MRNLVAVPLLIVAVVVQSAIIPSFTLLAGFMDLLLVLVAAWALQDGVNTSYQWALLAALMMSLVSRLPWFIYVAGYVGVVMLARVLQRRVWQVPMLAMFTVTFLGTVFMHLLSFAYIGLSGSRLAFADAMGLVTLPSLLLNLLIGIPVFGMMRDLSRWVFPSMEPA